jgi:3'(2'), 5'-bisphosphate nucleotidase
MELPDVNILIGVAREAGELIVDIFESGEFQEQTKKDNSPVTLADKAASKLIIERLRRSFPFIPIISEEEEIPAYEIRQNWQHFFLIDPLDGTKEFIAKRKEFTVNIAYVFNGRPVLGVVHCPLLDLMYFNNAVDVFVQKRGEEISLPVDFQRDFCQVAVSRSHMSDETAQYIEKLSKKFTTKTLSVGSALKLCYVAEGKCDIYPRFGPTSEWDTAAAHALIRALGGHVVDATTGLELGYNKKSLLNPSFIVVNDKKFLI